MVKGICVDKSVALLLMVVLSVQVFICFSMAPKVTATAAAGISDPGYEQATILRNGQALQSKISPVGSTDWFEIRIDLESDVVIETYGLPGDTGDIVMNFYYQNLTLLASGDNGGSGLFSKISAHLNASIYYVSTMENGNDTEISEYYINVTYACAFQETYGGVYCEGRCVKQSIDGGYVIAGSTVSFGAGGEDVYLVKTDSSGIMQWSRTYGGAGLDWGYSVEQTLDEGYVVVGYIAGQGVYLIKTDQNGYSQSYSDVILDEGTTLIPTVVYSILHDPPGDESYSYIEQSVTTSTETTLSGGSGCTTGFEVSADFLGNGVDASSQISVKTSDSRSDAFVETYQVGWTSSQENSDPLYIGPGRGDVFFGESWLLHYRVVSRTYINGTTENVMEYGPTRGVEFAVTATWIRNNVQEPWRSRLLAMDLGLNNVVESGELGKVSKLDTRVISGGIDFHQSYSVTSRSSSSFTFEVEMSYDVAVHCGFDILGIGASGKAEVGLTFSVGITQATSEERTTEIGYHIMDHDSGDTLVVDIYYDKVFGTYLFTAKVGTDTTNPVESYEHDIAVTNVDVKTVVCQGYGLNISSTVKNLGLYTETFNVTAYANITVISIPLNVTLTSGNSRTVTFTWDTTGFAKGNYTISAYAWPVSNETDTSDNNFTGGSAVVSMVGDLTGGSVNVWDFVPDGKCNGKDLSVVAKCFGSYPGCSPPLIWNANCDLNNDGRVDGKDIATVAKHFGQVDP
ncbi:MAG: hypothetical protein ABSC91_10510 [Candidatus Bathyarchaeia archaeon]